ncbi:MAG: hypothetical protein QOE28_1938 [Solirubrobacteraceae bacterium]|jgi:uncharacterized protein (DUF1697 family)|nr:hypothetical protein [Solirubrobacteraceae bacterium]
MARQIALLRGINLGSRNRVSMPDLRAWLERDGYGEVRTLVQSGNIVLETGKQPATVERELCKLLADELGLDVPVVVRTRDELEDVIERNPFPHAVEHPKQFQISFLSGEPSAEVVTMLADGDFAPEEVAVSGREVYAWHPEGIQRSPLSKQLTDKKLGVTATARNWNTVTKLLELADEAA